MEKIYFDYAATSPTDPEVLKAMEPYYFEVFGNASSPHSIGRDAQKALEDSRKTLADVLGATREEIVFTSGATESNNHAIFGLLQKIKAESKSLQGHIIVSSIEHHSVLEPIEYLEKQGCKVTYLKVNEYGMVDPNEVADAITDETILVAIMHASNEIGTIQPISEISNITNQKNIPLLVDAVQTTGHIPFNVNDLGADFLSLSAHKFYGPKGIGALYIRQGTKIGQYLMGGDQERDRRASTQNVVGAVGLAKAIELCQTHMDEEINQQTALRNRLIEEVPKLIDGVKVNGDLTHRLPNNAHFSFENLEGESLLMSLDMNNICASMGSACTSGAMEPSHVLRATGLSDELAYGSLRITIGRWTTSEHIDYFLEKLPELVGSLRI